MNKRLRLVLAVPAASFLLIGAAWFVAPAAIAPVLELELAGGKGLSSQVGDLGSFFLTAGGCILLALVTERRSWLLPSLMLVGLAALGRVVAWAAHGAAFAFDMLAVEVPVCVLLYVASREPRRAPQVSESRAEP